MKSDFGLSKIILFFNGIAVFNFIKLFCLYVLGPILGREDKGVNIV